MKVRLRVRKVLRALYAIGGLALALMWFWPKVTISMEPRDDAALWFFILQNESLLSITDVTKQKAVTLHTIRPCIKEWTFALAPEAERKSACGTEHIAMLRSGDAHTFRCMVPTMIPPTDQIGGSVELRVDYRYLHIFPGSTTACFEYAPNADGLPRYIRRSCSTPARTLPYDCTHTSARSNNVSASRS